MLRTVLLSVMILISLSSLSLSKSILRKSLIRRQVDVPECSAIEGFECKCSFFRVTCTTTRDLPTPINIIEAKKHKYQSVELVIGAAHDIKVNDQTFETVKQLYKNDAENLEFRIKFEKFTKLHLSSSSIFNRVFPDNLPLTTRKHLALEIYNPEVAPNEDLYLFKNLNVDALEVYALYPFRGSFQQLFDGANIRYLRLSGGDIRSDLSKSFTGNIARLELAKQASALSVQNFPVYPAHELIINAFYITEFNSEYPPNYSNLGELRVYSTARIPANAFQQFPNIHTLSITTDQDVDPKALDGLSNLEKLIIKEAKPSITILNSLPNVKEFETNIENLDEEKQCQLVSKLANGEVAVQAISNGLECTCITAYLNAAVRRAPCEVQDCDRSTCSAIKNNYDSSTNTFKSPPVIQRADGTDALHQRSPKIYKAPYQVSNGDREKLQQGIPQHSQQEHDHQQPSDNEQMSGQQDENYQRPESQTGQDQDDNRDEDEQGKLNENGNNQQEEKTNENQSNGEANQTDSSDSNIDNEVSGNSDRQTEESSKPSKKGMNWLPIIIIVVAIVVLLLIGIVIVVLRKRSPNPKNGYGPTPTKDEASTPTKATALA